MKNYLNIAGLLTGLCLTIVACNSENNSAAKADSTRVDTTAQAVKPMAVDSGHLVGVWHDEAIKSDKGDQIAYEVVSSLNTKKIYIQAITFTGTDLKLNDTPPISSSASEIKRDGDHFVSVERPGETYKVDKKGNLVIYDNGEIVAVCKKIL
ncbi:hypothetical protein [Mucilaginibacter sp.]|uniref:hypothetical protein n=1 Tax=Mucilaginibacter sp. TaxID=1882438 RepID=UPI0035BBCCD9